MKMTNTKTCLTLIAGLALAHQASADLLDINFNNLSPLTVVENQFAQYEAYSGRFQGLSFLAHGVRFDDGNWGAPASAPSTAVVESWPIPSVFPFVNMLSCPSQVHGTVGELDNFTFLQVAVRGGLASVQVKDRLGHVHTGTIQGSIGYGWYWYDIYITGSTISEFMIDGGLDIGAVWLSKPIGHSGGAGGPVGV